MEGLLRLSELISSKVDNYFKEYSEGNIAVDCGLLELGLLGLLNYYGASPWKRSIDLNCDTTEFIIKFK